MLGMALGEIFEDGEAVPHHAGFCLERGHLASGRVAQDFSPAVGLPQPDALFDEGMPQAFSAIQGLKLQDDKFLSPITSV
jgi:hypothetical protein